jgi:hypothetical protein
MYSPSGEPWGVLICRACTVIAIAIVALVSVNFVYTASIGQPSIPIAGLVMALMVWLIGRFFRFALAG